MAATTKHPLHHTPSQANALLQALLDSHVEIRQLGQEVGLWLATEDPMRLIGEIDLEDQARLVDRVDTVRFQTAFLFLLSFLHTWHI